MIDTVDGERAYPPSPVTAPAPVGLPPLSRLAHLPAGLRALALLAGPCGVVGLLVDGPPGVLAAFAGLAVVAVSFCASTLAVAAADRHAVALTLPVALAVYAVKASLLGVVAFAVTRDTSPQRGWHAVTGWSVLAGTLGWLVAQVLWSWRTPRPYVVVPHPDR